MSRIATRFFVPCCRRPVFILNDTRIYDQSLLAPANAIIRLHDADISDQLRTFTPRNKHSGQPSIATTTTTTPTNSFDDEFLCTGTRLFNTVCRLKGPKKWSCNENHSQGEKGNIVSQCSFLKILRLLREKHSAWLVGERHKKLRIVAEIRSWRSQISSRRTAWQSKLSELVKRCHRSSDPDPW